MILSCNQVVESQNASIKKDKSQFIEAKTPPKKEVLTGKQNSLI